MSRESFQDATPAQRGPRTVADTGGTSRRAYVDGELLTMGEVEQRLMAADTELEHLVHEHMRLCEEAAHAEANWKGHRDRVIVQMLAKGERTAADTREAYARSGVDPETGQSGEELYRSYKLTEARAGSSARAMKALESRMSVLQTIASNLRSVST